MSEHKLDSKAEAVEPLEAEELAQARGGATPANFIDISGLRARLDLGGLAAYHIKDSGPTWVNSPRHFDFGRLVLPTKL